MAEELYEESREYFENMYGRVWNTSELQESFRVHGFLSPFVVVTNKETN